MAAKGSVTYNNSLGSLEQEYRNFITSLPYPYAIFVNRKLVTKNDLFIRLFPWTKEESPSLTNFFGRKNADLLKEISTLLENEGTFGRISTREVLLPTPDRKTVAVEFSASLIQFRGKRALYCTFTDVNERRRILDQGEAVDAKFQVLLEASPLAISVSLDGKFVLLNSSFARMFGYDSVMDLLGKSVTSIVSGRNARNLIAEQEEKRSAGDESDLAYEYTGTKKDGSKIFVEVSARRIRFNERWAVLSYHRDVTHQRTAEEIYERKSKGLELLNRISDDIAGLSTLDDIYRSGLHAAMKGTQFESGAVLSVDTADSELRIHTYRNLGEKVVTAFAAQHLDEGLARFFNKTHEPIVATVSEYPPYLPYKGLFEGEGYTTVAFLPLVIKNTLRGILFLATARQELLDAHDRVLLASLSRQLSTAVEKVLLEDTARDAAERFTAAVSNISDVLYTLRPDGTFVYLSPSVEKMLGYIPADFMANAGLWRTLLHPDDRPVLSRRISNQATGEDEFHLEYRILPKGKATYIWLEDRVRYKKAADGSILFIEGILHDITARKQLPDDRAGMPDIRLLASTGEDILHALPEGIAAFDNDLICTEWNRTLEYITGVSRSDVIGKSIHDMPVLRESILQMMDQLSSEDGVELLIDFSSRIRIVPTPLHLHVKPMLNPQNVRTGILLLVTRGDDSRQRELDITESEETLRSVIDAMGDALLISDLEGEIWEVNREFTRMTGYERDEVRLKHFPYPWLLDEEMTRFLRWVSDLHGREHLHDLDMTWVHKNGDQVAVSLNTTLLRNVHGEPIAILNIARDISERRQLVLDLEWKNRQFELLNRIISHANTTTDLDRIFESIATEVHALIPYDGMSIVFLDERQQLSPWYHAVPMESGESRRVDRLALDATVIYDAIRSERAVIVSASESRNKSQITIPLFVNEKALGTFSLLSDLPDAFSEDELSILQPVADQVGAIIQRVRLFRQVENDSTYLHNLLNSIDNVVYTVDSQYRITEVNKAWSDFMIRLGLNEWADEDKIVGQSLRVIVPESTRWEHYTTVMDDLFARRIEYYARDITIPGATQPIVYHMVVNPMVIGERVVALVFTHTDITDINRTEAELKRLNRELVAVNAITTSINMSLEVEAVLRVAVDQLKEIFDAHVVAFYLLEESRGHLVLTQHWGIPDEYARALQTLPIDKSLTGIVITSGKPIYIEDGLHQEDRLTEVGKRLNAILGLKSSAVIPLQSKEKILGAFMINFSRAHAFSESEQQLLLLIGNQIGGAVDNAQLYEEVQQQVKTLTTLYELGKGLTGALDLKSMIRVVYSEMKEALPSERFYYQAYLPDEKRLSLVTRVLNGVEEFYPAGMKVRALADWPNTIYQEVVSEGKGYLGSTTPDNTDSILAVPLKSDQKVIGIISIISSKPNFYKPNHLRLLESIANLTGVAIGKALLYEDTLKKSSEIENRNKELDDFTYVVSHDLKEPLISIEGYSKIVMKDYKEKLDEEGKEYLGAIVQSTSRMKNLIDDLLTLSRLGRMTDEIEVVSVRTIIDEILYDLQFSLREKKLAVHVAENMPVVRYSGTRLSMVFRNLISNAMKFCDKPLPKIDIGVREADDEFVFSVADNGIGIEPQYFERIFTIFQRLKRSEEFRGTGAGLTIAKRIVEREGGRIWLDSTPGVGSTFYFTVKKPA